MSAPDASHPSTTMRAVVYFLTSLVAMTLAECSSGGGLNACRSDSDCKGSRICVLGACQDPVVDSPDLGEFSGHVSDSGEGRWTIRAAIDESVPAPVLSAALYARFSSRGEDEFADKLLSALRFQFGGHKEKTPQEKG